MIQHLVLSWIRFYQKHLSKLKGRPCCRFYPTCSSYTLTAVERFGAGKGLWLGMLRILRCNPLFPGGIDPVPRRFSFCPKRDRAAGRREKLQSFLDIDGK
jgi:putative membrane protein insertion efficiency factor